MSDTQFQWYSGALSLISLAILVAVMLFGSEFSEAFFWASGFMGLSGLTLVGLGLWTRRYQASEKNNG